MTVSNLIPISNSQLNASELNFIPRPIVSVGAGGIVNDAHLPAYRKAGFPVIAILDPDKTKAESLAARFDIPKVYSSVAEALPQLPSEVIFDVAVPANAILKVLAQLPDGAAVLIQKPMGETLAEAVAIERLCREKDLTAAVNFQLRWSPVMQAARNIALAGTIGDVHDMKVDVTVFMPWDLWNFMARLSRLEILYHSIHYVDLCRAWFGNPRRVLAKTSRNPLTPDLVATRSVIILEYDDWKRVSISSTHAHTYPETQQSQVTWEGTEGALEAIMGVNLDYPAGKPDRLRYAPRTGEDAGKWQTLPTEGNWFPEAFMGSMGSLQAFVCGASSELPTRVSDALDTMRTVEAAYLSSELDGQTLPEIESEAK
ncbi:Gfo/Idh/MocA family protein [Acidicapsa ligni]|uniref:Gfo/Idh/MocA family protein n=1 Tax=Acidicapsa ligni TaxID=542300 RepID=UPI0021E051D0|nr:Gfo/Idh/MocA family oxidoreductase [Acidicapsa ligni]